uniref:Ig-like domain-containing protein n=1 Tax=Callorhinchus milii TaxID=7868 RepID=A0A4W3H1I7_CALMI
NKYIYSEAIKISTLPTPLKIFSRVPERFSSAFLVLVCETAMFYPENLNLSWYKNGIEISSGITITKQQNAEGLYEASSSITETQTVRTETVYTCQVSHPSLQILKTYLHDFLS